MGLVKSYSEIPWGGSHEPKRLPPICQIADNVQIHPTARINVSERLVLGYGTRIGENCEISGRDIDIGAYFWMDKGARIGGGSCFGRKSKLRAGHFLHMGWDSFINTARPVEIGDEVGLGTRTAIYTHGAYLSALEGFPVAFASVTIGCRVWIPGATINPGVRIGSEVVIGVGSVVTKSIPSGALAAGVPAEVIREEYYPRQLLGDRRTKFWKDFFKDYGISYRVTDEGNIVMGDDPYKPDTFFNIKEGRIEGAASEESERLRDQMRRYGIRFYSRPDDGWYIDLE